MGEPIRLQKYLSQAGVAARRKAETMITEGRVKVNGKVVTVLGTKVDPARDRVEVDGAAVKKPARLLYLVMNKPKGCVTTVSDPEGRKTVMDYLPPGLPVKVRPVGRLDFYTEGVLLLTNDGELHAALLAPRSEVKKTYHAKIRGEISDAELKQLRKGVTLDDGHTTLPAQIDRLKPTGSNEASKHTWVVITIQEGQSRQIHRMFESLGHTVLKLARVAFGGITYFGLKVGQTRPLTSAEVDDLYALTGADRVRVDEPKVLRSRSRADRPRDHE